MGGRAGCRPAGEEEGGGRAEGDGGCPALCGEGARRPPRGAVAASDTGAYRAQRRALAAVASFRFGSAALWWCPLFRLFVPAPSGGLRMAPGRPLRIDDRPPDLWARAARGARGPGASV